MDGESLKNKIYTTFANVASSIGYSPLHGKIIAALLVNGGELSLRELAKEIGYSTSMVSLSLDLLEILGVISKTKKPQDRNLYVVLQGDLLECLKNVIVMKVRKSIKKTLKDFEKSKNMLLDLPLDERKRINKTLRMLEREIKRLEKYIDMLDQAKLPV
ncbi:MAG: hypothetical protein DRP15_04420 [Candidatus Aenigmatarchaeota archaeon]|nr:MAG: hypothetical protein DRP15_04420 [Candidatus Aenigmarchaeota archaeon]